MAIVCFDTHIVIWGIKKVASPGQENMLLKAATLIASCDESKHQIIIPSLVLGELLMGLPPDEHPAFISLMSQKLRIVPFDAKTASLFAKMWRKWSEAKIYPDSLDGKRPSREEIKIDYMIAATAKANKAECIYTEDPGLKKFAEEYIRVESLPPVVVQSSLLEP
ncbi:MAG: type II toxin-antitoxin system VapC family toxin [Leptolyngbya sp. BL-A-14]